MIHISLISLYIINILLYTILYLIIYNLKIFDFFHNLIYLFHHLHLKNLLNLTLKIICPFHTYFLHFFTFLFFIFINIFMVKMFLNNYLNIFRIDLKNKAMKMIYY